MFFSCFDADFLSHTKCESFYKGRENEFEVLHITDNGTIGKHNKKEVMYFYDTKLEGLLSYQAFAQKHEEAMLLWREVSHSIEGEEKPHYSEEYIVVTKGKM
jgi:hypothetical protein